MRRVLAVLVIAVLLVGCGKPEAKEDSYEDFVAEYYQTKLALHLLQNKYDALEADYGRLKGREAEYINAINTLTGENEALRIEVALVKGLGESQQKAMEIALNELIEKQDWARLQKLDYEELQGRYNKLDALFPPVHFDDKGVLIEWRASIGNITASRSCLELQKLALSDGHIVSIHPGLTYCVAVAGDYVYKITPGDYKLVERIRKVE